MRSREIRIKVPCWPHNWGEYNRFRFRVIDSGQPGRFKVRIFERCCKGCGKTRERDLDEVTAP